MNPTSRLPLRGLDGSNPLGFLAALGTLRTLDRQWPDRRPRLGWTANAGRWTPELTLSTVTVETEVVTALRDALAGSLEHGAFTFAENLKVPAATFAAFARAAGRQARQGGDRQPAEFAAAFACEAVTGDDGTVHDTGFRTMSGAGHQHFLAFMADLVRGTTADHLHAALFAPWRYDERKLSLRWDPLDDRRYALRWQDPSQDVIRTVRGANRLALEALPLFPVAPVGHGLETTGFGRPHGRGAHWTWPIWSTPIPADTCRSLLALEELQATRPDRSRLQAIGIVEVLRSERITVGKFRNFTPSFAP
jgi:hypothetical protein